MANNLRDIPSDEVSGKHTLAVRLGDARTRRLYQLLVILGIALSGLLAVIAGGPQLAWAGLATGFVAVEPVKQVRAGAKGPDLISVLASTGKILLAYSLILSFAIWVS